MNMMPPLLTTHRPIPRSLRTVSPLDSAAKRLRSAAKKRDWYLNDQAYVNDNVCLLFYIAPINHLDFQAMTEASVFGSAKPSPDKALHVFVEPELVYLFEVSYGVARGDSDIYLMAVIERVAKGAEHRRAEEWLQLKALRRAAGMFMPKVMRA